MRVGLTIGEFSRITHLSVKTLRRYHEAGLLAPDDVDRHSGYRYYSTSQVPTAQVIRRFRELGMPVREVRDVLAAQDPDARGAIVATHLDRLERELARTRAAVGSLRRLLDPAPAPLDVELRATPEVPAAAVQATLGRDEVLAWYDGAWAELHAVLGGHRRTASGPVGGLYDNELFTDEHGHAVLYVPLPDPPAAGRVAPFVVPAAELAVTVHSGSHDDIDVTYGALGTHVAEHALAVAGPVREVYLVGPYDTDDEAAWRTEIGWPVFRTATAPAVDPGVARSSRGESPEDAGGRPPRRQPWPST